MQFICVNKLSLSGHSGGGFDCLDMNSDAEPSSLSSIGMHRISGSSSGLPDILPFLISSSCSGSSCKLPDNEPDNLLIYY